MNGDGKMTKKELLKCLNRYLKVNAKARVLQMEFENALAEYSGIERDQLSEVMDVYIDMDISGTLSASMADLDRIIEESIEIPCPWS